MKKLIIIGLTASAIAGGYVGATLQEYVMRPKIIQNGAGHYDMITGEFAWGAPPKLAKEALNDAAVDLRSKAGVDKSLQNALKGG